MDKDLCRSIMERFDGIISDMRDCCGTCTDKNQKEMFDVIIETACQMEATLYNMCEGTSLNTACFAKTINKQ